MSQDLQISFDEQPEEKRKVSFTSSSEQLAGSKEQDLKFDYLGLARKALQQDKAIIGNQRAQKQQFTNALHIQLIESLHASPLAPNELRVKACFDTLNALLLSIPQHEEVFKTLIKELFKAIFSDQITKVVGSTYKRDEPTSFENELFAYSKTLDRIPWFDLVFDIQKKKNSELEESNKKTEKLEEQLKLLKHENVVLHHRIAVLRPECAELKAKLEEVEQSKINLQEEMEAKIASLNKLLETLRARNELQLAEIKNLEASHEMARTTILRLSTCVNVPEQASVAIQDTMDHSLPPTSIAAEWHVATRNVYRPPVATEIQMNLIRDMEAQRIQLAGILNFFINDFEAAILRSEQRNFIIRNSAFGAEVSDASAGLSSETAEQIQLEAGFKSVVDILKSEDALLKESIEAASMALQRHAHTNCNFPLRKHSDDLLNHYAVVMYFSNDHCRTFHKSEACRPCQACGCERVFLCPHMPSPQSEELGTIVALPQGTTHALFCRPRRLAAGYTDCVITKENDTLAKEATPGDEDTTKAFNRPSYQALPNDSQKIQEDAILAQISTATPTFSVLWHFYFGPFGGPYYTIFRRLSSTKVTYMFNALHQHIIALEKDKKKTSAITFFVMVQFLEKRYGNPTIALRVIFEIINFLEKNQRKQEFLVFARMLAGFSDTLEFYLNYISLFLSLLEPLEDARLTIFIATLYPMRSKVFYTEFLKKFTTIDHVESSSTGEEKQGIRQQISPAEVLSMLRKMATDKCEPNIQAFRNMLWQQARTLPNRMMMPRSRFLEFAAETLPSCPQEFFDTHYKISEHAYGTDKVGITRLAEIMSLGLVVAFNGAYWGLAGGATPQQGVTGGAPGNAQPKPGGNAPNALEMPNLEHLRDEFELGLKNLADSQEEEEPQPHCRLLEMLAEKTHRIDIRRDEAAESLE